MMSNVIYNEDCFETFKRIEDKSIDMVLTSPPYDNLRSYNGFRFDFENTARELFRVLKDGGVIVWVVGDATINGSETGTSFKQALYFKEIGFNLHDTMIYRKRGSSCPASNKRYFQEFEYMFVFSKGIPITFNGIRIPRTTKGNRVFTKREADGTMKQRECIMSDDRLSSNVWDIDCGYMRSTKDKTAYEHPAIFPDQLALDHIKSWSNEGDTILDCFIGSGTTAIACLNTNRNYIGCELDKGYYDICMKRIQEHKAKLDSRLL